MTLIPNTLLTSYSGSTFNVELIDGNYWFRDHSFSNQPLINDENYITLCSQIHNFSYDSILIGGLGLGYIPYWVLTNTSCSIIDVVDNNNELISWATSNNHLGSSVNLIENDIYNYSPSSTYDLILIDIWWGHPFENIKENQDILITHLSGSVNQSGSIYFCLSETVWTKS